MALFKGHGIWAAEPAAANRRDRTIALVVPHGPTPNAKGEDQLVEDGGVLGSLIRAKQSERRRLGTRLGCSKDRFEGAAECGSHA